MSSNMIEVKTVESPKGVEFAGRVYEREDGGKFVSWELAQFACEGFNPVTITATTGEKGTVRAAAFNLRRDRNTQRFLQSLLSRRKKLSRVGQDVVVEIPGASVHVPGFEEPMAITLKQRIGSYQDIGLALNALAGDLKRAVSNGVYVQWPKEQASEPEEIEMPDF
jgi:hypothetical protein